MGLAGRTLSDLGAAVRAADPDVLLQDVQTLPDKVVRAAEPRKFNARVVSALGAVALALAVQGLYGLLAFVVERSRRTIGVRLTLGARGSDVARLVGARGLRLVVLGLALGLPAGHALARAASSVLFGVTPADPTAYVVAAVALATTALAASLVPARQAARLDPAAILREP